MAANEERLRVSALVDGAALPPWQEDCLRQLEAVDGVELTRSADARSVPAGCDLALDLRRTGVPTSAAGAPAWPRLGVWRFDIAEPIGARELIAGGTTVDARLLCARGNGQPVVVSSGIVALTPYSLAETRARLLRACAQWPARLARMILAGGESAVFASARPTSVPATSSMDTGFELDAREKVALALALARGFAERAIRRLHEEKWNIGLIDMPIEKTLDGVWPESIRWLPEDWPEGYWADPMGLEQDGQVVVLVESMAYGSERGTIDVRASTDGIAFSPARTVIQLPWHLSFPFLLRDDGEIYCIPKAYQSRRVTLLRAEQFPDRWVEHAVLLADFPGVDTVAFEHDGRWWMLNTSGDDEDQTKLYGWYAPELLGPWTPHPGNPLKCDIGSTRPAGPPFVRDGELYRPAQDCSRIYGGAVVINHIERLTPTEFLESTVARIDPDPNGPYPKGLHTLSPLGRFTLVDGKRHFLAPGRVAARVRDVLRERLRSRSRES